MSIYILLDLEMLVCNMNLDLQSRSHPDVNWVKAFETILCWFGVTLLYSLQSAGKWAFMVALGGLFVVVRFHRWSL